VSEDDRAEYLFRLASASRKLSVAIHAYALMPNHVHLLATPDTGDGVGRLMQAVGSGYVRSFNARNRRTGTLWDGRYYSSLVGSDRYLWNCYRYIELNPVRAGIVVRPEDFRWSSHARNALGAPDPVVTPHSAYLSLARCYGDVPAAYRSLFTEELGEATLTEIRYRLSKERAYADEDFIAQLEKTCHRSPRCRRPGRPAQEDAPASTAEELTISDLF
jgi:putative transposase